MSGFLPRGYFRLAEIRDVMGVNELGSFLASGDMIAAARDTDGTVSEIHPSAWMDDSASDHISAGELPATEGLGPFPLFVRSRNPNHLIAIMDIRRERAAASPASTGSRAGVARARGPRPAVSKVVADQMSKMDPAELEGMKEEVMAATFGASRDTCRKARGRVLAGLHRTSTNPD